MQDGVKNVVLLAFHVKKRTLSDSKLVVILHCKAAESICVSCLQASAEAVILFPVDFVDFKIRAG